MSRVLKGSAGSRVIDGEVFDATTEARRILDEARRQAEEIVASAEATREEARARGHEDGRQEGLAQVTEILARARAEASRLAEDSETELKRLAVRIAEKILGREIQLDPAAVLDVTRQALAAARARRELTIRVHPEDLPVVESARPRLAQALTRHAEIAVCADDAVTRGGCLIDTEVGTIDGRLEIQLGAIERALCGDD